MARIVEWDIWDIAAGGSRIPQKATALDCAGLTLIGAKRCNSAMRGLTPICSVQLLRWRRALQIILVLAITIVVVSREPLATSPQSTMRLAVTDKTKWNIFRDHDLGIEFSYPNSRRVLLGCHSSKNCVALINKTTPAANYLVAFEVFDGGLDTVAVERAVFLREENNWIAKGRVGRHPVEPLAGPGWQGLKSVVDCGISEGGSFHAGAGECLWVVVSNGKRSVVVDTQGITGIDEETMRSIQSIRFYPR